MNTVPYIAVFPALRTRSTPPYQSQQGNGARNDCGPAAVLMLARWVGKGMTDTVAQWSKRIDPSQDGTTDRDLAGMIQALGLTPVLGASAYPRIDLVRYNKLPHQNPDYRNQTFLHWIVRLSDTTYHDPLWNGNAGANLGAPKSTLDAAIFAPSMSVGIKERPQTTPMTTQRTIKAISWNVRTAPTTKSATVGVLVRGDKVNVTGTTQGEGGTWLVIPAQAGGAAIKSGVDEKTPVLYYMRADGFEPLTAPAPTPQPQPQPTAAQSPASKLLGLHVISHHHFAVEAYNKGARSFVWMEGHTGASEFKAARPDAMVVYRKNIPRGLQLNAQDLINMVDGMSDPNLLYIGENENDQSNSGDLRTLEWRLRRDAEVARLRPGRYVMGEFSMGTPQLEHPDVQRLFRDIIAPIYNRGDIWFGTHTYTPKKRWLKKDGGLWMTPADGVPYAQMGDLSVCDPIWFPWRWRFLFTHCGFDPRVRKIFGGETGADEGGVGGFPAQQTSDEEFARWCIGYLHLQRLPLTISGGEFAGTWPSPFAASVIFQRSDFPDWLGYKLSEAFMGILQRLYTDPATRSFDLMAMRDAGEEWIPSTPPVAYVAEPKIIAP